MWQSPVTWPSSPPRWGSCRNIEIELNQAQCETSLHKNISCWTSNPIPIPIVVSFLSDVYRLRFASCEVFEDDAVPTQEFTEAQSVGSGEHLSHSRQVRGEPIIICTHVSQRVAAASTPTLKCTPAELCRNRRAMNTEIRSATSLKDTPKKSPKNAFNLSSIPANIAISQRRPARGPVASSRFPAKRRRRAVPGLLAGDRTCRVYGWGFSSMVGPR